MLYCAYLDNEDMPVPNLLPSSLYGSPTSPNHPTRVATNANAVEQYAANLTTISDATQRRKLEAIGASWFLDMLSGGFLLEELAISLNVRFSTMAAWLQEKVPAQDIEDAKEHAAALYRIKALRAVEQEVPVDKIALGYTKLKYDAYRQMAEAMDPGKWNAPPSQAGGMGVANVTINLPDPTATGGVQQYGPGVDPIPDAVVVPSPNPQVTAKAEDPLTAPPALTPEIVDLLRGIGVITGGSN